jgi:hypothetical protein
MKTENDKPYPDYGEEPDDIGRNNGRRVVVRRRDIKA